MANQIRPTSVGNVGTKKREKNKAIMQEFLLNSQVNKKFVSGAPIVGLVGNHNLSVNITNIAGNINGLRQQLFFEEDFKANAASNNSFIKPTNNPFLEGFAPA